MVIVLVKRKGVASEVILLLVRSLALLVYLASIEVR